MRSRLIAFGWFLATGGLLGCSSSTDAAPPAPRDATGDRAVDEGSPRDVETDAGLDAGPEVSTDIPAPDADDGGTDGSRPCEGAGCDLELPQRRGATFTVDDWDHGVTGTALGTNHFAGNTGAIGPRDVPGRPPRRQLDTTSSNGASRIDGRTGGSLRYNFDLADAPGFEGLFFSLLGLSDTRVSLDRAIPTSTTRFPDYYLDTEDLFRGFRPWAGRHIDQLAFDIRLLPPVGALTLKIELEDERHAATDASGCKVALHRPIVRAAAPTWQTVTLALGASGDFPRRGADGCEFNWRRLSQMALVLERDRNPGVGAGTFLLDNLRLADATGSYPDPAAARRDPRWTTGAYDRAFLRYVRETSFLHFLDFASTDPRTGGIIQDRGTFADLMTLGGVGFQLTAYVIGAARGYITHENARDRIARILRVLADDGRQCDRAIGCLGYRGFVYHFAGIDGLRKQNFNFEDTAPDESRNTVELSTIDTALALCGVIVARQYFDGHGPVRDAEIVTLADQVLDRVEWRWMLDDASDQLLHGWKPAESRFDDEQHGCYLHRPARASGGAFSSHCDGRPLTLDYYTDEAVLALLLGVASRNPAYRLPEGAFFAPIRDRPPGHPDFVRTFPGSLFTYQFSSVWLDTDALGPDRDPSGRVPGIDYFENTRRAIALTREHCATASSGRCSALEAGLSACEGPFNDYFAESAPAPVARADGGRCFHGAGGARPLEVGTLAVYGVGSSIVHAPRETLLGLWAAQDLGLLHPRFGFADAYNRDIGALASRAGCVPPGALRRTGAWASFTGFAIDHGPMIVLIDNYLEGHFVPRLFMSYAPVRTALRRLFPSARLP